MGLIGISKVGFSCKCGKFYYGATIIGLYLLSSNSDCSNHMCGFDNEDSSGWICAIYPSTDTPCSGDEYYYLAGDCYSAGDLLSDICYCSSGVYVEHMNCEDTSTTFCYNNMCPPTNSYNGKTCVFADGASDYGGITVRCHKK